MTFTKATKYGAKLRMSLTGPSGAGKTWTALTLASHLAGDGRIALIDTENGSANLYADVFDFDVQQLTAPYTPERYIALIHEAEEAGYTVIIVDSLSHEWAGPGGMLEIVDDLTQQSKNKDSRGAWRVATPRHNKLMMYTINACKAHIICTMRSKTETVSEKNDSGRTITREIGLAPVQRDNIRYEFDIGGDMEANTLTVVSGRFHKLTGKSFHQPGKELADALIEWLTGKDPWDDARQLAKSLNYTPQQWSSMTRQQATDKPEKALRFLQEQARSLLNKRAAEQESEEDAHLIPDEQLETALVHLHDELRRFPAD